MNYTYLSSNVTIIYKFIFPITYLLFFVFFVIASFTFFPKEHFSLYISFGSFLFICLFLNMPLLYLKKIYYSETHIYIDNYKVVTKLDINQIVSIKSFLVYFYKLTYLNDKNKYKKVIFIPHISEKMAALMGMPKSIIKFIEKIKKE